MLILQIYLLCTNTGGNGAVRAVMTITGSHVIKLRPLTCTSCNLQLQHDSSIFRRKMLSYLSLFRSVSPQVGILLTLHDSASLGFFLKVKESFKLILIDIASVN